jgi:DNA-binding MarR family transcriptional regulator
LTVCPTDNEVVNIDNSVVNFPPPGYSDAVETSKGARLALLLLESFTAMAEEVVAELARQGHPGVTVTHEFALRAIDEGANDASALGRRLEVSKQAAAKTITALEHLGYVERVTDPNDARRKELRVTARGYEMQAIGGATFDKLRKRWQASIGSQRVRATENALRELNAGEPRGPRGSASRAGITTTR